MSLIFKSPLIKREIKHWLLIVSLTLWAVTATALALSREEKVILIGMDESGTRVIADSNDRLLKVELQKFVMHFIEHYYGYDEKTYREQVGRATEVFSEGLWEAKKTELFEIQENLKKTPLSQKVSVDSIELIEQGKIEVGLVLNVQSRLNTQQVHLSVSMEFMKMDRTEKNPWGYVITSLTEKVL